MPSPPHTSTRSAPSLSVRRARLRAWRLLDTSCQMGSWHPSSAINFRSSSRPPPMDFFRWATTATRRAGTETAASMRSDLTVGCRRASAIPSPALQRVDHDRGDIDLVQTLYRLQAARALGVDFDDFVADHVDADEEHPVLNELVAHRLDHRTLLLGDLPGLHAAARADVGTRVVALRHPPERGHVSVDLDELAVEQEDPHVAVLGAVDVSLCVDVAVLENRFHDLVQVGLVVSVDHEHVAALGPAQRFDDGAAHGRDEVPDVVGIARHQRSGP